MVDRILKNNNNKKKMCFMGKFLVGWRGKTYKKINFSSVCTKIFLLRGFSKNINIGTCAVFLLDRGVVKSVSQLM